ncbi:MAG TPA: STAS domain-containing protein [Actinoplanes sp.]|nr:STAS domain-containing protein [Actinoplanes sp.]
MSVDSRVAESLSIVSGPPAAEVTVVLAGEIDRDNCRAVRAAVGAALADRLVEFVCLDMGEVTFLDSAGIRELLLARRDAVANGGDLAIGRAHRHVREVLEVTGLLEEFRLSRPAPS